MHVVSTEKPEKTDNSTTIPPSPRAVRLKTLADCRRAGAKTFNLLLKQQITESEARARGYLLQILSGLITQGDIEARLKTLEESMEGSK